MRLPMYVHLTGVTVLVIVHQGAAAFRRLVPMVAIAGLHIVGVMNHHMLMSKFYVYNKDISPFLIILKNILFIFFQ